MPCYRVPIQLNERHGNIIIGAPDEYAAAMRATEMADALLGNRLPWLMERGTSRPQRDVPRYITVGYPVIKCHGSSHEAD